MELYENDIYKYMTGLPRFWVEWDKYTHTHEKVSIHWFKKLCKRCGLSSREMRTVLRDGGHIAKRDLPCAILKRATVYHNEKKLKQELLYILKHIDPNFETSVHPCRNIGICKYIEYSKSPYISRLFQTILRKMFKEWPYYSGVESYPIDLSLNHPYNDLSPRDQYNKMAHMGENWIWHIEYNDLRRDLLKFLITRLESQLNEVTDDKS